MDKPNALLLLGGKPDEGGDELEMALKSFFRAGEKGNFAKAAEAFREAIALADSDEESDDDDESDDESDDDDLML